MPQKLVFRPFTVNSRAFHELIAMPQFADTIDIGGVTVPNDEAGDWAIMDNINVQVPILELYGNANIIKRRDATCKLIYSPIGRLGNRFIRVEKLYAAVEDCQEEFYQGCFEDWTNENFDMIFRRIMPMMESAVGQDIYTNKYFGDLRRLADVSNQWSWNKFDGIFTHIANYIASGVIPIGQTFGIAGGPLTPTQCHDYLETAFNAQPYLLKSYNTRDKAFYVDQAIADGYNDWLVLAGQSTIAERQAAVPTLRFRGIEIKVKQWDGILAALNAGTEAHAIILTLRGNFIYGADSSYGGGPKRDEAIRVWYSMDDNVWRRQIHFKAGTEILGPQFIVLGLTSF